MKPEPEKEFAKFIHSIQLLMKATKRNAIKDFAEKVEPLLLTKQQEWFNQLKKQEGI